MYSRQPSRNPNRGAAHQCTDPRHELAAAMAARAHGQGNRGHGNPSRDAPADYGYDSDEDSEDQMIADLRMQREMELGGGRDQTRSRGRSQRDMEAIGSGRHRSMGPHDMDSFDDMPHSYDDMYELMENQRRMGHGGVDHWSDLYGMAGYGGMSSLGMGSLYLDDHHGRGHGYMDHHDMGHPDMGLHGPSDRDPSRPGRNPRSAYGVRRSRSEEWDDVGPFSDRIYEM